MSIRTIMIFPEFKNINVINNIRKKYDPLADLVLPHITLVFHFESDLTNEEISIYLKQFKPENDYVPHMTVGKLSSIKLLDEAFEYVNECNEKFSTLVKKYQLK